MRGCGSPARGRRRRASGFTIFEVLLGLVTLALAATAVMQGMVISAKSIGRAEAGAVALEAARGMADRIAATPLNRVVPIWGAEGSEGPTFDVETLDGTAATGRIWIVTNEIEADPDLRKAFGLPRDLDGDGLVTSEDVSGTARVLPVLVEVRWGRTNGERVRLPVVVVR